METAGLRRRVAATGLVIGAFVLSGCQSPLGCAGEKVIEGGQSLNDAGEQLNHDLNQIDPETIKPQEDK